MRLTPATFEVERPSEPFEIEMDDGKVYTLRHPDDVPIEVLAANPFMDAVAQLRSLVGDEDFPAFIRSTYGGHKPDNRLLKAIKPAYDAHYGLVEPPESGASSA